VSAVQSCLALNFQLAPWSEVLIRERSRYKVVYGGRGSGKSWQVALVLLLMAMMIPGFKVLCAREFQMSIKESVHTLLSGLIARLRLPYWDVGLAEITYKPNGSTFIFAGLWQNVEKIQSFDGVNVLWVEEGQKVSDHSWKTLIPTIRTAPPAGWPAPWPQSEIWITMNPIEESDPTAQRFIVNPPPNTIQVKVNWRDNPWLPSELRDEAEFLRRADPEEYYHVWEGYFWTRSDAQVFNKKWGVAPFVPGDDWVGPFYGIDFGFSTTPMCIGKQWVYNDCLYVQEAYGGLRVDTGDIPEQLDRMPEVKESRGGVLFRADSARPEVISFLDKAGYCVCGAEKGPGSVEDGISFLRSFNRIVIHPDARMAEHDARLYKYKVDKHTDEVLKEIVKKNDDFWDQCRYALEPLIQGKFGNMNDIT
jgi:phage terminase large subunit